MPATVERPLALVTGASTGIGYELAKVSAENGFDLIVAADDDEIRRAGEELRGAGANVDAVRADMEDSKLGANPSKDSAADVARDGYEVSAKLHRKQAEPGSAEQS